jgi:hypothetical protein
VKNDERLIIGCLATETVKSLSLTLQSKDDYNKKEKDGRRVACCEIVVVCIEQDYNHTAITTTTLTIHGSHSLSASMLRVSDGITDNVLKKDLENSTSLFVNESRNTLDTTTTSETTDSGLGDSLDVVTKDLAMTLGASLSKSLSSFATARHAVFICFVCRLLALD